jgi:hypothetical protein
VLPPRAPIRAICSGPATGQGAQEDRLAPVRGFPGHQPLRPRLLFSVCCMYAIKEAVIAKEHAGDLDTAIFFMDMRTYGKDFEKYYDRPANEHGVRLSEAGSTPSTPSRRRTPALNYATDNGEASKRISTWWCCRWACRPARSGGTGRPPGTGLTRLQFHQYQLLCAGGHQEGVYACGCFRRSQGHPPVGDGGQCRGLRISRGPWPKAGAPDRRWSTHSRKSMSAANAAPHRGVRLQLRHQHRRCGGCAGGAEYAATLPYVVLWIRTCSPAPRTPRTRSRR